MSVLNQPIPKMIFPVAHCKYCSRHSLTTIMGDKIACTRCDRILNNDGNIMVGLFSRKNVFLQTGQKIDGEKDKFNPKGWF